MYDGPPNCNGSGVSQSTSGVTVPEMLPKGEVLTPTSASYQSIGEGGTMRSDNCPSASSASDRAIRSALRTGKSRHTKIPTCWVKTVAW